MDQSLRRDKWRPGADFARDVGVDPRPFLNWENETAPLAPRPTGSFVSWRPMERRYYSLDQLTRIESEQTSPLDEVGEVTAADVKQPGRSGAGARICQLKVAVAYSAFL